MIKITFQAVCYTCSRFVGPKTQNQVEAEQDKKSHDSANPEHDLDIRITQSWSKNLTNADFSQIEPFVD